MKKTKAFGFVLTLLLIIGCEELPDPAGLRGVAVIPSITDLAPGCFNSKDLANSYIEFVINVPAGTKPDRLQLLHHTAIILKGFRLLKRIPFRPL
jgi:hypothetical protein